MFKRHRNTKERVSSTTILNRRAAQVQYALDIKRLSYPIAEELLPQLITRHDTVQYVLVSQFGHKVLVSWSKGNRKVVYRTTVVVQ